ncbi:MAG: formate dehydrogenase subunit alpha [Deltaproteobacteria bacterium]|nr:MAG: formate dehydrogenase subunit alpha [Deltaproteobacteria bacterium]
MIKVVIDGKSYSAKKGERLIDIILRNKIDVPHLCYEEGLSTTGSCGLCLVEIKGKGVLKACEQEVYEGMEVITESEQLEEERKKAFLFLLTYTSHPTECLFCDRYSECSGADNCLKGLDIKKGCKLCPKDGDCVIQRLAERFGLLGSNIEIKKVREKRYREINEPFFIRDYNYCLLCSKCIRVCYERRLQNSCIAYVEQEGHLIHFTEKACVFCGSCIDICPSGVFQNDESRPDTWIKSVCPYCGCGCGIELGIKDGSLVKVKGDKDGINKGELCVKGRFGISFVNSNERLKTPLLKHNGSFKPISWELALDIICKKFKENIGKIGVLGSAKLTNEENFLIQKFSRLVLKTNNVDHCARLCHSPTGVALSMSLEYSAMTNSISDVEEAKTIVVIGANPTENHPIIGLKIKRAKANGSALIVINPKRIELCEMADLWLSPAPGTDAALLTAMAKIIVENGLQDTEFIEKNVTGFNEYKDYLSSISLDEVIDICGISKEKLYSAAELYAKRKPSAIYYAMGITQHLNGTQNVLAISNLAIITGNIGIRGGGINPLRGQNNVQGACDMGVLPDLLPGYKAVWKAEERIQFEQEWNEKLPAEKGLTLIEQKKAILDGRINVLYIIGENPVITDPDVEGTKEALKKVDFLLVQDIFLSDTARLADLVLPSASFAEKEGTFTNTERRVQILNKALDPPGSSMSDQEIICMIAKKMGYEKQFSYTSSEDVFQEIRKLVPEYRGITYERLRKGGIQWPCYEEEDPGTEILYKDGFKKKARLFKIDYLPKDKTTEKDYPFLLITGRSIFHFHSGTMTMKIEGLNQILPEPFVEINPTDAFKLNIKEGDQIRIISKKGEIKAKAIISEKLKEKTLFATFHFPSSPVNRLVEDDFDPLAKIPAFKAIPVNIKLLKLSH